MIKCKKMRIVFLSVIFLIMSSINVMASDFEGKEVIAIDYEYFADGSYFEIVTYTDMTVNRGVRNSYRTSTFYNENKKAMWYVTVTASFSYDGNTSKCTSASASAGSYVDTWKIKNKSASRNGNKATATATANRYFLNTVVETLTRSVTLGCDKNGNLI